MTITLNTGVELPALGFGVFQTPPDVTQAAVEEAVRVGYRMIDTAASYLNEREVGAAIAASGIPRSELFVQTKVWVSDYGYDQALHGFEVSTRKLGLDTVDLYLLHQPLPQEFDSTVDAYRAAERLLAEGRVRRSACPTSARRTSRVPAAMRSCRPSTRSRFTPTTASRPFAPATRDSASRRRHGRRSAAYTSTDRGGRGAPSPNRSSRRSRSGTASPRPGHAALAPRQRPVGDPKSVRPERIAANLDVFDFALTPDEIAAIDALDTGVRGGPNQDAIDFRSRTRIIPERRASSSLAPVHWTGDRPEGQHRQARRACRPARENADAAPRSSLTPASMSARNRRCVLARVSPRPVKGHPLGEVTGVIHAAGVSPSQASPATILGRRSLRHGARAGGVRQRHRRRWLRRRHRLAVRAPAGRADRRAEQGLATTPADELLGLPMLQPDEVKTRCTPTSSPSAATPCA